MLASNAMPRAVRRLPTSAARRAAGAARAHGRAGRVGPIG